MEIQIIMQKNFFLFRKVIIILLIFMPKNIVLNDFSFKLFVPQT